MAQPNGYLAVPDTGTHDGVLVLHAWWGLNDTMKQFCDRLAGSGWSPSRPTSTMARSRTPSPTPKPSAQALDANADQATPRSSLRSGSSANARTGRAAAWP